MKTTPNKIKVVGAKKKNNIVQVPLGQLPWYRHLALLECLKSRGDRIAYAALAIIDGKTIGILLCKSRNEIVAEYSLADLDRPIGVSTYRLGLPSLEQLQAQLRKALATPGVEGTKMPHAGSANKRNRA